MMLIVGECFHRSADALLPRPRVTVKNINLVADFALVSIKNRQGKDALSEEKNNPRRGAKSQ